MGRSFLFFPRKEHGEIAEPGPPTRHIRVNRKALEGLFHLKLKDAAREIGLCSTTFKKACRRFQIDRWPSRRGQRDAAFARRNAQTDVIDGAAIIAWRESPACSFSSAPTASSSPTVRAASKHPRDYPDPFGGVFSSASCIAIGVPVPDFQHTWHPTGRDGLTTWDEEIWTGTLEEGYGACGAEQGGAAPLVSDPPDVLHQGRENVLARNQSQELPPRWLVPAAPAVETDDGAAIIAWRETPAFSFSSSNASSNSDPPTEQSCLEAVMAYLDGPLAGNFDFMFEDEEAGCEFV
jgi:hypothetical protein